jgi:hypothetical protein
VSVAEAPRDVHEALKGPEVAKPLRTLVNAARNALEYGSGSVRRDRIAWAIGASVDRAIDLTLGVFRT